MFPFQDHRRLRAVATPLRAEVSTGITAKLLLHVPEAAGFFEQGPLTSLIDCGLNTFQLLSRRAVVRLLLCTDPLRKILISPFCICIATLVQWIEALFGK